MNDRSYFPLLTNIYNLFGFIRANKRDRGKKSGLLQEV